MAKQATVRSAGLHGNERSKRAQAVFDAATDVFLELGYDRTSVGKIAKRAGSSKETIYNHFGNKQELFGRIISEVCEKNLQTLEIPDLHDKPPEEVLYALGKRLVTALSMPSTVALYRIVISEAERYPELANTFWEKGADSVCNALASYLEGDRIGGKARSFEDPRLAAEQFIMMARSTIIVRMLLGVFEGSRDDAIEKSVRQAVKIFLHGCQ